MTRRGQFAFTLIELLVVIAIIALLVSILMPALGKAKELAKRTGCLSNLHNLALSTQMYIGDFNEFPYNWDTDGVHDEKLSNYWGDMYRTPDGGWPHPHYGSEGLGRVPYWTEYFVRFRYAAPAQQAMGCTFSVPKGWHVLPFVSSGVYDQISTMSLGNVAEIFKYPTYMYRGPSSVDDYTMNASLGGQIAFGGASDPAFGGASGTYYPRVSMIGRKPKPLFHCPAIVDSTWLAGQENYAAPHAFNRSIRPRTALQHGHYYGHYLAQSVGWSDGRAVHYEQPPGNGIWFVNYDGEISTSEASRF